MNPDRQKIKQDSGISTTAAQNCDCTRIQSRQLHSREHRHIRRLSNWTFGQVNRAFWSNCGQPVLAAESGQGLPGSHQRGIRLHAFTTLQPRRHGVALEHAAGLALGKLRAVIEEQLTVDHHVRYPLLYRVYQRIQLHQRVGETETLAVDELGPFLDVVGTENVAGITQGLHEADAAAAQ
jgi:hypothetical protein